MSHYKEQFVYTSYQLQDTEALAVWLADAVVPGTVIGLDGDLGAGKTAFSQQFAKHLGVKGIVNSPTFTIIKEYEGKMPFYHMDVYRLSIEEADELGLDEYFYGKGVCLVEWSQIISDLLPTAHLHLSIATTGSDQREITIHGLGEPYENWCRNLKQNGVFKL
ncbi:tRNA (adenosine(37)-N6)-threonylcarbamoyltransferase complex ATPase subunit type 1 TsaE [Paenibacillus crassostreae]|uniref:tRNA threonylcarbamoyladenosine biosynthesis protein TsaE n=1 Tax=Paenibacillus crassostreae TaxID=1763538 RepID=A0A167AK70_9BACL|nr:tRNA (adenosine(37)-N6)-threonylcarbamoyltransferase complex ATPase subunit type 1 TsaE [Paenibacillus crassostreae]AOZ94632.1 tRNA (adenosine(37)-N6)-threonylcarbamoyltransferase complex ATPase subunit type 1 TsaE [Paenibacillus crassostreae]OAB71125.1 tRNA threonylcarbamoyladenosine biosynthesis protein TsaE [Paenibacillus crassostreae]